MSLPHQSWRKLVRSAFAPPVRTRRCRPAVEWLEDRLAPAAQTISNRWGPG
jgi:hypothetical protein